MDSEKKKGRKPKNAKNEKPTKEKGKKGKGNNKKDAAIKEEAKQDKQIKKRSAWNFYFGEVRQQLQQEFPDKTFPEITKIASERFKNLDPKLKEKYNEQALKSKAIYESTIQAQNPENAPISKAEKERKQKISPYFRFSVLKHEELKKNNPDMTYKERAAIVWDVWKSLSMIEKTYFETDASAATASLEHHEEPKDEEEKKNSDAEKDNSDKEDHSDNETGNQSKDTTDDHPDDQPDNEESNNQEQDENQHSEAQQEHSEAQQEHSEAQQEHEKEKTYTETKKNEESVNSEKINPENTNNDVKQVENEPAKAEN
ncbi:HMG box family protein [Trichomonas vaginalis G3]|uniref:HMG box family protein n=1 Tax=Trichomonas vaginalis (strain ATCC PRA-98 / G3) TaxID=412133 RepID=A2EED6_TRIV3|nr:HMG-box family [Trichomonas vaginalis G3]EAY08942.1 HMG box family protein [Trichomonas vaginalis G3]KAI5508609.1 HMG-box family [Trichomonas vaginalis G3]|eukprot:XP_001321165.1 HMG box family protein [Trichomonas vaginalis G3]